MTSSSQSADKQTTEQTLLCHRRRMRCVRVCVCALFCTAYCKQNDVFQILFLSTHTRTHAGKKRKSRWKQRSEERERERETDGNQEGWSPPNQNASLLLFFPSFIRLERMRSACMDVYGERHAFFLLLCDPDINYQMWKEGERERLAALYHFL